MFSSEVMLYHVSLLYHQTFSLLYVSVEVFNPSPCTHTLPQLSQATLVRVSTWTHNISQLFTKTHRTIEVGPQGLLQ